MKIFIGMADNWLRTSFISETGMAKLRELGEVVCNDIKDGRLSKEEFAKRIEDVDVVVTGWGNCKIDAEVLKNARNLKIIMHTGGSVGDLIDPSVYDETNVKVISGNDYYAESVAEGTLAYILCALRRLDFHSSNVKKGLWRTGEDFISEGLLDRKVGIISLGAISKHLLVMAKPFRIDFSVYSTRPDPAMAEKYGFKYRDLESIFRENKIISVHTALNKNTIGMLNKKHFSLMQDGALLVNTSRGRVINDDDLVAELKTGRINAVLDVYAVEPIPNDSPYMTLDNVTLYPHIAGPTPDRRPILTNFLIDDVKNYFNGGTLKNEITKEVAATMTVHG